MGRSGLTKHILLDSWVIFVVCFCLIVIFSTYYWFPEHEMFPRAFPLINQEITVSLINTNGKSFALFRKIIAESFINSIFPADVVSIPKIGENFRLLYDTKGRFRLHSIKDEEAKVCFVAFSAYASV